MPPRENSDFEKERIERLQRAMYSRTLSDKIKDRPRRALNEEEAQVPDDFLIPEPGVRRSIVAPRTIGVARSVLWWLLGGAILFCLAAVAFFGYFFLAGGGSLNASAANIDILVSSPQQVQSGEPTELLISVTNRNTTALELADLVLTYPSGTRSASDFTTDLPSDRISLGTIQPGETRQGKVPVVFNGVEGQQQTVKVELDYHLPNSNAIFVAPSTYTISFASSPITVSVDGNSETISGQPVQLIYTVRSNAVAPVNDVVASVQMPFGFKQTSVDPAQNASSGLWELGTLAPGQERKITLRGVLSGEQSDERVFRFSAGTRAKPSATSITTPLANNTFTMTISKPFLGLMVMINNATGKSVVVSPGDAMNVSIAWQNNLPTAITDAAIVARFTGVTIDGSTVRSPSGFFRSSDNIMLWDKTTDPSLANLAPGEHGTVTFSFQMPSSDDLKNIVNPSLDISINAAGNRVSESGVPENMQATTEQKVTLASDLQLQAQGLYYSNPFTSTGPMPPKAGTETTYGIVFTVTNTTNKITDATMTATLPSYVRWVGIYSPASENVSFNQLAGTVTWKLGDIAPGAGLNGTSPRQAAIAIGFTPSTSQIGQKPALLQGIVLHGTDASTGQPLGGIDATTNQPKGLKAADVTTNITSDPGFSTANAEVVK